LALVTVLSGVVGFVSPGWSWDMLIPFWGPGRLIGSGIAEIMAGRPLTGGVQIIAGIVHLGLSIFSTPLVVARVRADREWTALRDHGGRVPS
jgi:hypothetical protein